MKKNYYNSTHEHMLEQYVSACKQSNKDTSYYRHVVKMIKRIDRLEHEWQKEVFLWNNEDCSYYLTHYYGSNTRTVINKYRCLLRAYFTFLIEHHLLNMTIEELQASCLLAYGSLDDFNLDVSYQRTHIKDDDEMCKYLEQYLSTVPNYMYAGIMGLLWYGVTPSELATLPLNCIDYANQNIIVNKRKIHIRNQKIFEIICAGKNSQYLYKNVHSGVSKVKIHGNKYYIRKTFGKKINQPVTPVYLSITIDRQCNYMHWPFGINEIKASGKYAEMYWFESTHQSTHKSTHNFKTGSITNQQNSKINYKQFKKAFYCM